MALMSSRLYRLFRKSSGDREAHGILSTVVLKRIRKLPICTVFFCWEVGLVLLEANFKLLELISV